MYVIHICRYILDAPCWSPLVSCAYDIYMDIYTNTYMSIWCRCGGYRLRTLMVTTWLVWSRKVPGQWMTWFS